MRAYLLLLLFSVSFLAIEAQPAPDFTITDASGQQQQLYADHLNQGKTVVLKLFFTNCPPCNSIAPLTEPLYQSWGGGDFNVEFISLSILSNDMNTAVAAYKSTHGLSYPGAGADGGSISATQPYMSGTYGTFLGTPTFVVISPQGDVHFDPRGPSQQATLDSVSAAIAATGALMPFVNYDGDGQINTMAALGINNVQISIDNLPDVTPSTDINGTYNFNSVIATNEDYYITASKDDDEYTNGLSTGDLLRISQHILGVDTFSSPLHILAADADRNKKITTLDLIFLRKLLLGIDLELVNQPPWIFINANYQFTDPKRPFNEAYDGEAAKIMITPGTSAPLNFTGVKIGDVNDSVDPSF
jgi:thiol-disulfide isomerase/thioredoxin